MIIQPKVRGFVCITAHPLGCAAHVQEQIDYVKAQGPIVNGPKKALIIGASTGYGLSSRIVSAFACRAATIGVFFERPSLKGKTASAGWYNSIALEKAAHAAGLYAKSINGDAFSDEVRNQTLALIKKDLGQVDLIIYSLAAPRRIHPKTGQSFKSTLKPINRSFTSKNLDTDKGIISEISIDPATKEEIAATVAVMGGENWEWWVEALESAGALADGITAVAYSYIGPEVTWPIYRDGTIGKAKEDLEKSAQKMDTFLQNKGGRVFVSINKAVVTQASSAIPIVPLYTSILLKVMKEKEIHEGCIEQIYRLYQMKMYNRFPLHLDEAGRVRLDDCEMRLDVQQGVVALWRQITTENLDSLSDFSGYKREFLKLFGFGLPGVDYNAEVDPEIDFEI